jgi:serine/threonine-protein kinase HipA
MLLHNNIRIVALAPTRRRSGCPGLTWGLQSKLLLVQVDGGWARPVEGTPSTHILKPDPPGFPGLVASEAFAQRVAALAGLDAAEVRLEAFGDRLVLVVTRFDRQFKGGRLVRRHQEDGCQALGTIPVRTR